MDFHGGDYVMTHAIEARRGSPDCQACHREQSFCVACHERSGVGARAGGEFEQDSDDPGRHFHPDGWVSRSTGANRHAYEARRNLDQCASCHREDDCVECHSNEAGGLRINPHPANWRGSARCKALARRAGRMCLRCHVDPNEDGCNWRGR
jgi:hypothetical protein